MSDCSDPLRTKYHISKEEMDQRGLWFAFWAAICLFSPQKRRKIDQSDFSGVNMKLHFIDCSCFHQTKNIWGQKVKKIEESE